jgi:hypothetical protein
MDPQQLPLRDLHLPDAIGLWPLAPGWWLLIALLLAGLGYLAREYLKQRRRSAARRFALKRLEALSAEYAKSGDAVSLGAEVSELVRRTMLAYAPRSDVAGLTGEAWLEWLDRDLDRSHFVEGDGRPLIEWPYRSKDTEIDRSDVAAFVDAVRLRLETPVGGTA